MDGRSEEHANEGGVRLDSTRTRGLRAHSIAEEGENAPIVCSPEMIHDRPRTPDILLMSDRQRNHEDSETFIRCARTFTLILFFSRSKTLDKVSVNEHSPSSWR